MIAAKVANALALDYPRERLEVIVACDGCADATAAARARGRRRPRARAAARRQDPRAGRRRRARRAARSSPSPTPTRCGSPTRCARSSAPSPTRASATPAARCASCRRADGATRDQPGGPVLALRDGAARARVAAVLDHRRQRRDLRDPPRRLHRRRPDHGPRPLAARSTWSSAAGARSTCRRARASEKMVPVARGRVRAQAADDEPHLADRPARRHALAARLPAALRADDRLAPRCCATPRRRCTCSRSPPTSRSSRPAPARSTSVTLALQLALLLAGARSPASLRAAPAADRALLRAHHRLARRRACGTGCATAPPPPGRRAEGTR